MREIWILPTIPKIAAAAQKFIKIYRISYIYSIQKMYLEHHKNTKAQDSSVNLRHVESRKISYNRRTATVCKNYALWLLIRLEIVIVHTTNHMI